MAVLSVVKIWSKMKQSRNENRTKTEEQNRARQLGVGCAEQWAPVRDTVPSTDQFIAFRFLNFGNFFSSAEFL